MPRTTVQTSPQIEALAIVVEERVVRPGDGGARGEQDERVEEREVPGVEDLDALRRPVAAGEGEAGDLIGVAGEEARVEEGPEPRDEEHHLRGDEEDHAVAEAELHDRRVVALLRLLDDVAPPDEHGVEHAEDAGDDPQQRRAVHEGDQADRQREGRDRRRRSATGSD